MKELFDKTKVDFHIIEKNDKGVGYSIRIGMPTFFGWIDNVKIVIDNREINLEHIYNRGDYAYFYTDLFLETKAIYKYYFKFKLNGKDMIYDNNLKLSSNFCVPDWAKGKIMYHIFVDRFNKSSDKQEFEGRKVHKNWNEKMIIGPDENGIWNNDYYGGDLAGIIEKLDYIKSLGVSILYLSPIVYSQSNHRYDTTDYELIDPYLGDFNDLEKLCDEAHKRGIKVIVDAVFNHTGDDSKYFDRYNRFGNGAYNNKNSIYHDFYRYNENNDFEYWWGFKNLPETNCYSEAWKNYICGEDGIIDKWFSHGIDGLRLDVADELSDEYIELIRKAVKRNKEDGLIIGEVWYNPMRMNRHYLESGKGMDSVMNYLLIDALIRYFKYNDDNKLRDVLKQIQEEYPEDTINSLMNFTSTHDISRIINILGSDEFLINGEWSWNVREDNYDYLKKFDMSSEEFDELKNILEAKRQGEITLTDEEYEQGKDMLKRYLYTLIFLPGVVSIFYGDEIGIQGLGNLSNRKSYTWDNIDYELLSFYRELGRIRGREKFLEEANLKIKELDKDKFIFEREKDGEKALIIVNNSENILEGIIPEEYLDYDYYYNSSDSVSSEVDKYSVFVLKKTKRT